MNTKKWLALGLSVALAATAALAACAPEQPKEPDEGDNPSTPHVHTYDAWDYDAVNHWKYCDEHGTDKSNIDKTTRAPHQVNPVMHACECGYVESHTHKYTAWSYDDEDHFKECTCGEIDETSRAPHTVDPKTHKCTSDGCNYRRHPNADVVWHMANTQHWKQCSTCKWILEETRGKHKFVDGTCEVCGGVESELFKPRQMYVVGYIASMPGNQPLTLFSNREKEVSENCLAMTLSENETTYTAEVYLVPADYFGVYDLSNDIIYPAGSGTESLTKNHLRVEEANTYLISWEIGAESPTLRVHDHKYTDYRYDDTQHWKVCPSDGAVEPDVERQNHVYDQPDNKCVCGAVETVSCDHSKGYDYHYEELPKGNAEGGTLQKTCPDCHDAQDVTYSKGFTGDGTAQNMPTSTIGDISKEGTYYFTTGNKYQTLGLKITEAGTYTLTFEEVCDLNGKNSNDGQLGLAGLMFGKAYASMFSIPTSCVANKTISSVKKQDLTDYAVKVNEKNVAVTNDIFGNLVTLSFTVTEEQLQAGDLYVTIHLCGCTNDNHTALSSADSLSHLVTVKKD